MDIHYNIDGVERTKSVVVADSSYRYQEVMGEHSVTLNFSLAEYFVFPVGSWILYENVKYRLFDEEDSTTKQNERQFDYTLVFKDPTEWMTRFKLRNMVDGRLAFTITAQPFEFIDHIVNNLNARSTGVVWRTGDCIVSAEKTQSFSHNTIADALNSVAQLFETEYETKLAGIDAHTGKQIYDICLKKVEYNKLTAATNNAQRLEYGKGNGLLPGIDKTKGDGNAVDVVWVEGGDRNIDSQTYIYYKQEQGIHANKLRLPRAATVFYLPPTTETDKGTVVLATDFDNVETDIEEWIAEHNPLIFQTDEDGFGLHRRQQDFVNNGFEESLELTDIYPHLTLNVTQATLIGYNDGDPSSPDPEKYSNRFWDIRAAENTVNYNDYMIGGEQITIIFNTGMLAGKEFNLAEVSLEGGKVGCYDPNQRLFKIQPCEVDGITMPDLPINIQDKDHKDGTGYIPRAREYDPEDPEVVTYEGDEFAVFHVSLPSEYIDKAERELLLEACHYLYQHGEIEVQFTCNLDGIFSRNKWETMRQYFVVGGYINFVDKNFCQDGRLLRILAVKDYINTPHAPELTLSNSTVSQSVSSELKKIAQNQVYSTQKYSEAIQYSKRNFRDAEETQKKIAEAYGEDVQFIANNITQQMQQVINDLNITQSYFSGSINPVTVRTMSLLIGDKNLQFKFGHAATDNENKVLSWTDGTYEPRWSNGTLFCPASIQTGTGETIAAHVRHDYWTKNQNSITTDAVGEHPYWIVNSATLTQDADGNTLDPKLGYFLYLQCPRAAMDNFGYLQSQANFRLYSDAHATASGDDFYLLVGILNAELNGCRTYCDMYGSVEINGNQMRVEKIISSDGNTYFDLKNNVIAGNIKFVDGAVSKDLIVGQSRERHYGGMTGDDVFDYYGGIGTELYGKKVRLWFGNTARIVDDAQGKSWLYNANIVVYQDCSFRVGAFYYNTSYNPKLLHILTAARFYKDTEFRGDVTVGTSYSVYGNLVGNVLRIKGGYLQANAFVPVWVGSISYQISDAEIRKNAPTVPRKLTVVADYQAVGYNQSSRKFNISVWHFLKIQYNRNQSHYVSGCLGIDFSQEFMSTSDYFVTAQGKARNLDKKVYEMSDNVNMAATQSYVSISDKTTKGCKLLIADDATTNYYDCYVQIWAKSGI